MGPTVQARIVPLSILLMVLGALPAAAAPQPAASAAFLGMAVASGVRGDAQGLTDIVGIQYAIKAGRLPVTQDLQVYTRWTGTGTHTVTVAIRQASTGTDVRGTSDDLDFGADRVTWFQHDLSATTFPDAGAYLVQVTLDGTTVATYALYVNTLDQLTDGPAFVLSVPAERGWVDGDGNANLSGIFEYFSFADFPATESFSVVTVWFSGEGDYDHFVRITDAGGTTVAQSRRNLMSALNGRMAVSEDAFESTAFPAAGLYTATIFLNGYQVTSFPLVIRGR